MVEEFEFEYKPKRLRIVIENVIAFIFTVLIIIASNSSSNKKVELIDQVFGGLLLFIPIFIHNTFLLKPAIKKQAWLKYSLKLFVFTAFIFPFALVSVEYIVDVIGKSGKFELTLRKYLLFCVTGIIAIVTGGGVYMVKYFFIEQRRRLKAELLLKKKQIALIQSQINPHFLFNSLNSIKALTSVDPEKAKYAIVQLSELLRKSLNTRTSSLTSVDEELVTVKDYLELEKMRYGDRLEYSVNVDVDRKRCTLPAMSLQVMVENAIKHGIDRSMVGGTIYVNIYSKDDLMFVEVKNTGQISKESSGTGIGTRNIIEQLKILYNEKASYKLFNGQNNTVTAQLIIPIN